MKKPIAKAIPIQGHDKLMVATTKLQRWHTDKAMQPFKPCGCVGACRRLKAYTYQEAPLEDHENPLVQMRLKSTQGGYAGCKWAAYQNVVLNSAALGHVIYLPFGVGCTYENDEALPAYAPDGMHGLGWRYRHVGYVNLETGEIEEDLN